MRRFFSDKVKKFCMSVLCISKEEKINNRCCLWEENLKSFANVDTYSDVPKCKFILKNSSLECLVVFPLIVVAGTKLIYGNNFIAPLSLL